VIKITIATFIVLLLIVAGRTGTHNDPLPLRGLTTHVIRSRIQHSECGKEIVIDPGILVSLTFRSVSQVAVLPTWAES
jgi:hypothetical protein